MAKDKRNPGKGYSVEGVSLGWRGTTAVANIRDPGTGKRQRIELGKGLTPDAARAALDRFVEARRAIHKQQASYTVGQLWERWLADRAEDGYSNTIYGYNWRALAPHFASRDPLLISLADCRAYARARFAMGRAPATVWTELVRLRHCLKWSVDNRLIDYSPKIWVPSQGEGRNTTITAEQARALLNAAFEHGDPHIYLFIVLCLSTAARHRAILELTWSRVDFVRGTIQYDEMIPPDPMHKSWRKGRATVPMNALARAALERAFRGRQSEHVIEHGGRRLTTVRSGFANAVARAGLPDDITPHALRHSVSTWLKEKGVDMEKRAQLLGHADSKTTDLHYSHADSATYLSGAVEVIDIEFDPEQRPERVGQHVQSGQHRPAKRTP